jgi:hypothetical protein
VLLVGLTREPDAGTRKEKCAINAFARQCHVPRLQQLKHNIEADGPISASAERDYSFLFGTRGIGMLRRPFEAISWPETQDE